MSKPFKHNDIKDKFSEFEYSVDDASWDKLASKLPVTQNEGLLSNTFSSFEVQPSSDVWKAISTVLDPKRKKRVIWWWVGSAACVFVLLSSLIFDSPNQSISNYSFRDFEIDSDVSFTENIPTNTNVIIDPDFKVKKDKTGVYSEISNYSKNSNELPSTSNGQLINNLDEDYYNSPIYLSNKIKEKHQKKEAINQFTHLTVLSPINTELFEISIAANLNLFPEIIPLIDIPLIQNNTFSRSNSLLLANNYSFSFVSKEEQNNNLTNADQDVSINPINSYVEIESIKEEFEVPFSLNLNIEHSFKPRLALGFGLGVLISKSKTVYSYGIEKLSRNYLTVPVYLKYNFIKKRKLSVYTSLGTGIEFSLFNKRSFESFSNVNSSTSNSRKNNLGLGQMNGNFGIGSSYFFTPKVQLFFEGSVSHYFYLSHYTYWSNMVLWPVAKAGLIIKL